MLLVSFNYLLSLFTVICFVRSMGRIGVISSCLVATASSNISMSRLELNPWNLQFLLLDPIQKGILFRNPPHNSKQAIVQHLKSSLSRTLDFFPPLAGRLATTRHSDGTSTYFVDCNSTSAAGAEFTHAVAGGVSVSDILEPKCTPQIVSSFFPLNGVANCEGVSTPLLAVQVTELADGIFIGCTANHVVVDGTSFWHFLNSWSQISRGCDVLSTAPRFPAHDRLIRLPPLEHYSLQEFTPPPLLERIFHFSKECLGRLKSKANLEAGTDRISSLQALSAHLWRSVSVTRCRLSSSSSEEAEFMIVVGARPRIPLPEGYFGTAVYPAKTKITKSELLHNGLGYAALKINQLVSQQTHETATKFVEDWLKNPTLFKKQSGFPFVISSSPLFDVYGNDFGWGKPIAVRSGKGQKLDGKMTVYTSAVAGAIDVEACLAPDTLQAMECDAEFMETMITN